MTKTPHVIAQDALTNITFQLLHLERDYPLSHHEINSIIELNIKNAYVQVTGSDRTKLHHSLLIHISYERLTHSHKNLYDFLNNLHLLHLLNHAVNRLNTGNLFQDIARDPLGGVGSIINYVAQILSPLIAESERYPGSFKKIANIMLWLLNCFMLLGCTSVVFVISFIAVLDRYADSLLTLLFDKLFNTQLASNNEIIGIHKIGYIFATMYSFNTLAQKGWLLALIIPATPLITLVALCIEFLRYVYAGLIIATCALATAYFVTTLVLVNMPLYLLDAYRSLFNNKDDAVVTHSEVIHSALVIKNLLEVNPPLPPGNYRSRAEDIVCHMEDTEKNNQHRAEECPEGDAPSLTL